MEARSWVETLVDDPERRASLESRMSELHHHARKYQVEVSALPTLLEQLIHRCDELERALEAVPLLEKQLDEAHQAFLQAATKLSESRAACAPVLSAALTGMMRQLGVSQGEIKNSIFTHGKTRPIWVWSGLSMKSKRIQACPFNCYLKSCQVASYHVLAWPLNS